MEKVYFRIVIPNYNNGEWIEKCINSVLNQTYQDFHIVVVDDVSTDDSLERIPSSSKITVFASDKKLFNGGARNRGLEEFKDSLYTLFLDSDDWFNDNNVLEDLHKFIEENNRPDCINLSYNCIIGETVHYQELVRDSRKDLVGSVFVACWTKCIKTDKIVKFPENTLMEDVVQHIAQADKIETIVSYTKPVVCWNRNNLNSCSRIENQHYQNNKWKSSMYRYAADLMDLQVEHKECEEHRQWRLEIVLNNIKNDVYIQ